LTLRLRESALPKEWKGGPSRSGELGLWRVKPQEVKIGATAGKDCCFTSEKNGRDRILRKEFLRITAEHRGGGTGCLRRWEFGKLGGEGVKRTYLFGGPAGENIFFSSP